MKIISVKSVYEEIKKNRKAINNVITRVKKGDLQGFTPPSTLVGEFNYPKVSVGIIFTTDENAYLYDSPKYWVKTGYDVAKIFSMRTTLVNARDKVDVRKPDENFMQKISFATMSRNDLSIDFKLSKAYDGGLLSETVAPHGITADLKSFHLNENFRIDHPIEKVYYDRDFNAIDAINYLYKNGIDDNKINKVLSVGAIGVKRRLVPTKWAITAVDDSVGKGLIDEIKDFDAEDDYFVKTGTVLGNHFIFLFLKGTWSFELIETWNRNGNSLITGESDYEFYEGRKDYVHNTAGAYYAIRLAVLETLKTMKKQFSVIVIREITPEYFAPLGVWVVREGARKVLGNPAESSVDMPKLIKNAKSKLLYPIDIENKSKIINLKEKQKILSDF